MERVRVVGNILIGIVIVVIAFATHKTPLEAMRFLFNSIFYSYKDVKPISKNDNM